MATLLNANADPFRGGSFTPGVVPGVNGAIAPANAGGTLISSVQGSTPMLARNNRGSNVTVPYARVVLHPSSRTALPAVEENYDPNPDNDNLPAFVRDSFDDYKLYIETEALYAGRLCFILGRRGVSYDTDFARILDVKDSPNPNVPFRERNNLAKFAIGGSDINTMQRMCSFEYLKRYFFHILKKKFITLGGDTKFLGPSADDVASKMPTFLARHKNILDKYTVLNVDGKELLEAIASESETQNNLNDQTQGLLVDVLEELQHSGIFAADDGPFLRGKTLENGMVPIYSAMYSSPKPKNVPVAVGDTIAFDRLQMLIAETGACDWTPDGIVHSKLSQGDAMLDEELDSRDGMLFNITVKGPNVTSSWSGNKELLTQPLDKVFVVIVADVWDGKRNDPWKDTSGDLDYKRYNTKKEETATKSAPRNTTQKVDYLQAKNKVVTITNMRVRLTTSSEMVSCSALKKGKRNINGESDPTSRMGLMLSGDGGVSEYIIGGWCIGTVLDNSAARSTFGGQALMGAIKKQRTTNAINISVGVEWWSADRLYKSYMNVDSSIRTRFTPRPNERKSERKATSKASERLKTQSLNPTP